MADILNSNSKETVDHLIVAGFRTGIENICTKFADIADDISQQSHPILRDYPDLHRVDLADLPIPFDLDLTLRIHAQGIDAIGPVHRHTKAAGDIAHNQVTGNRLATFTELYQDIIHAFDKHAGF